MDGRTLPYLLSPNERASAGGAQDEAAGGADAAQRTTSGAGNSRAAKATCRIFGGKSPADGGAVGAAKGSI